MRLLPRVLAIVLTVTALAALADSGGDEGARAILLSGVGKSGVREASVPLDGRLSRTRDGWRTARAETATYSMLGVTWRGPVVRARVRTHDADGWSRWRELEPLKPRGEVRGTELLWVPDSDGFEVKVDGDRDDLSVELIDPGRLESDYRARPIPEGDEKDRAPRPRLFTRDDWGANDDWRNGGPYYTYTIKQVHIHHTATGNGYSWSDVPGIIRGMYRYHTKSLGWSDIGYNFLVDRFGRIWVGRKGGYWKPVRGAHTLGFNHVSTGVAVIGNHQKRRIGKKSLTSLVHLAAWKLDRYDRKPAKFVWVTSRGSDLYRSGKTVKARVIDGHRDTNQTACPGNRAYWKLWRIRWRTADRVNRFDPRG